MEITLNLAEHVYEALQTDVVDKGVDVIELIRFRLGECITGFNMSRAYSPRQATPTLDLAGGLFGGGDQKDQMKTMASFVKMAQAASGELKCDNCLQRVGIDALADGKCEHCQAAV